MLKSAILDKIIKKYTEIAGIYAKALEVAAKMLELVSADASADVKSLLEERERLIYNAEVLLKETVEISKQYARDNFLKDFSLGSISTVDPERAGAIESARRAAADNVRRILEADEKTMSLARKAMEEARGKLRNVGTARNLKNSYGFKNLNSVMIDKNI